MIATNLVGRMCRRYAVDGRPEAPYACEIVAAGMTVNGAFRLLVLDPDGDLVNHGTAEEWQIEPAPTGVRALAALADKQALRDQIRSQILAAIREGTGLRRDPTLERSADLVLDAIARALDHAQHSADAVLAAVRS